jgi:hypothetical protein
MAFWEPIGLAAPGPLTVKIAASAALVVVLWLLRILLCSVAKRRLADAARFYHVRRYISYGISGLGVILIYFKTLTPTVYTTVRDSGVLLTLRYIVKPRQRRGSEQDIWETILREFARHDAISLAYPTTRFYRTPDPCPAAPSASSPSDWILRHP